MTTFPEDDKRRLTINAFQHRNFQFILLNLTFTDVLALKLSHRTEPRAAVSPTFQELTFLHSH
jgi:hypothetical protein